MRATDAEMAAPAGDHEPRGWLRRVGERLRALRRDQSGAAMVAAALTMPALVGAMALSAELSYWYLVERTLQNASDVAAHAGARSLKGGASQEAITAAAEAVAAASGYAPEMGTIVVNTPPLSGPRAGEANTVEVILTESRPRLLSAIFELRSHRRFGPRRGRTSRRADRPAVSLPCRKTHPAQYT